LKNNVAKLKNAQPENRSIICKIKKQEDSSHKQEYGEYRNVSHFHSG
jgi:hypothetical protein